MSDEVLSLQGKQLAIQAIFECTDIVRKWCNIANRDFAKPKVDTKNPNRREIMLRYNQLCEKWPEARRHLGELNAGIDLNLQTEAAIRIGAYSRALRYFEMYTRDRSRTWLTSSTDGVGVQTSRSTLEPDGKDQGKAMYLIDVPKMTRNDGANHALPALQAIDLDLLMKILTCLDDPDGIDGVHIVRQTCGFPSTSWHRTLEKEHEEDWIGALFEYEMADQQKRASGPCVGGITNIFKERCSGVSSRKSVPIITSVTPMFQYADRSSRPTKDIPLLHSQNTDEETEEEPSVDPTGRLRCLSELGQLHSALDDTLGMLQRRPELESALIPRGVEVL